MKNPECGAVMVTTALMVVVLLMATALGLETFRLLASKIQLQNIAEYIAETELSDYIASPTQSPIKALQVINRNYFLAQKTRQDSSVNSGDVGFSLLGGEPIKIVRGCYTPATPPAVSDFSNGASCGPVDSGSYSAVVVKISTAGLNPQRQVALVLAQLFNYVSIDINTSAISYRYRVGASDYFITGPMIGTITIGSGSSGSSSSGASSS